MATGKIQSTAAQIISASFIENSYYAQESGISISVKRTGNVVDIMFGVTCSAPYSTSPGFTVINGLPKPSDAVYQTIPLRTGSGVPIRAQVAINGELRLRYGQASGAYDIHVTYICS